MQLTVQCPSLVTQRIIRLRLGTMAVATALLRLQEELEKEQSGLSGETVVMLSALEPQLQKLQDLYPTGNSFQRCVCSVTLSCRSEFIVLR